MNTNRVALVTGASRNIGRAIARRLAQDGCDIVVHVGHDTAAGAETVAEVEAEGQRAVVISADLGDPEAAGRLVSNAIAAFGRLDIVVNNAAIRPEAAFETITLSQWREVMAIALDAPFLISQAAVTALSQGAAPRIVNIGGLTGHTGAEGRAHVIAAKAGLIGLTKAMAHDLAPLNITVNCVVPGLIETARAGHAPAHHGHRNNLVGRRGTAEEVAAAVAYFCAADAAYLTGQTMHVNGGAYLP